MLDLRMYRIRRRSLLEAAFCAAPLSALLSGLRQISDRTAVRVQAGEDREGKKRAIGLSSTTYKVLTQETKGALFVLEQSNRVKGGPPRHLHREEDELFFSLEGEYIVEVGSERFHLKSGDCVLGPRGIPHAWAFVGTTQGRMLLSFSPAGKMEAFFNSREQRGIKPGEYSTSSNAHVMREFGMEYIGPPLKLD